MLLKMPNDDSLTIVETGAAAEVTPWSVGAEQNIALLSSQLVLLSMKALQAAGIASTLSYSTESCELALYK